jgi:hypothetical protein
VRQLSLVGILFVPHHKCPNDVSCFTPHHEARSVRHLRKSCNVKMGTLVGGVAQDTEHLPCGCETLRSNSRTTKK